MQFNGEKGKNEVLRTDVLVMGAGMSGLCAALSALEAGAKVLVIEKGERLGGSMWLSNGLIWSFKDKASVRAEIQGNEAVQDLVVDDLADGHRWLESQGVELSSPRPFQWYGIGRVADPRQMTAALASRVEALGGRVRTGTVLQRLHRRHGGGFVAGLASQSGDLEVEAESVILASGGFQGNPELMARHVTPYTEYIYLRANPWSTGDGLTAAVKLGAAVSTGLNHVYGHAMVAPPARFTSAQFSDATQRYGNYALALNMSGRRFTDESAGTNEEALNGAVARQERASAVYIVDAALSDLTIENTLTPARAAIARAKAYGGHVAYAQSLEELAEQMHAWGIPSSAALESMRSYNESLLNGQADQLVPPRLKNHHALVKPPFSAVLVRAGITFTCGGIATDADMRVLSRAGTISTLPMVLAEPADVTYLAIPGLFAVGCDAGGVSGFGYMGGLATALTTGRRAGKQAAQDVV